jgi:8-oxo-dGTP pyrophosphatase MutT (NUDIX family)
MEIVVSAGGVIIKDSKILFCHPTGSNEKIWKMPKGKVEDGEDIQETAIREVQEETGYLCKIIEPIFSSKSYITKNKGIKVTKILKFFLMEIIKKTNEPDWEHDKFIWVPINDFKKFAHFNEEAIINEGVNKYKKLNDIK